MVTGPGTPPPSPISLKAFFQQVALKLRAQFGLTGVHFLMLDARGKRFITVFSSTGARVTVSRRAIGRIEAGIMRHNTTRPTTFTERHVVQLPALRTAYWRFRFRNMSMVMPVYLEGTVVCLVMLSDRELPATLQSCRQRIADLRQEIAYCVTVISHYNQTMMRVANSAMSRNLQPASPVQTPGVVMVGNKLWFL